LVYGSKIPLIGDIVMVDRANPKAARSTNNVGRRDFSDVSSIANSKTDF
jgi:hypothetical protein